MTQEPTAPDLRDQMAMAALTGLLAGMTLHQIEQADGSAARDLAGVSYALADAMLAQRALGEGGETP